MKSFDIRTIQSYTNQVQTIWLPDFSEILNISYSNNYSQIDILYQYSYELSAGNQKIFNIWIIDSTNIISPPSEGYRFFGHVERKFSEIQLGSANNGKIIPLELTTKYYIFIEEIKTVAENREEKLNEIL